MIREILGLSALKYPLLLWWSLWNDGMNPGFAGRSCKLYPIVCTINRYLLFPVSGCDPLINPIGESLGWCLLCMTSCTFPAGLFQYPPFQMQEAQTVTQQYLSRGVCLSSPTPLYISSAPALDRGCRSSLELFRKRVFLRRAGAQETRGQGP